MSRSSFSFSRPATLAWGAALIALPVTATLAGCGSGSGDRQISPVGSGGITNPYTGRYVSTVTLNSGKRGALDLTVAANGTVTGTLTVTQPAAAKGRQVYSFNIGAYNMAGSVNTQTGAFVVTGGIAPNTFTVNGVLPVPGNGNVGGTYTVNAGGETYSGSFATPTNPVPTPTPTNPTPTPTPTNPPTGNGAGTFTLVSKSADCNFDISKVGALKQGKVSYNSGNGIYVFNAEFDAGDAQFYLNLTRLKSSGIVPETLTFTPTPAIGAFGDDFQGVLSGIQHSIGQLSAGAWYPSGGSLVVESVSGNTVRLRGDNVVFSPNRFNAISAKGTFTANFTVTVTNVPNL